jgi:hypothetical protein
MDQTPERIVVRPMKLNDLADVADVKPLSDADMPVFREVREVLMKHGALERFGLILLHKHFDLREGEELVEEIDVERRVLVSRPAEAKQVRRALETAWRFDAKADGPAATWVCHMTCRWEPGSSKHSGIMDHV